jgi:hypothetical protein
MMKFIRTTCCTVLCLLSAASIEAGVVVYFGGPDNSKLDLTQPTSLVTPVRNSFLASLSSFGSEDFETLSGPNPNLTFGATGITGTTNFPGGVNSFALYAVSGNNFLLDNDGLNDSITFSAPISAFGTYIVQSGDGSSAPPTSAPPNNLTLRLENTLLNTTKDIFIRALGPDAPFFNVIFVGVTDTDPFNRISFLETYDTDGILFDDVIVGAVPEPNAGLMVLLASLALARRSRRSNFIA